MLDSIYVATTGLVSFSSGLKNISNNVSNLNTPGYKATQLQFSDLLYGSRDAGGERDGQSALTLGSGTTTPSTTRLFTQGSINQTGNDLDAAIDGQGFFVARRDGETLYTRAGEFQAASDGFLVTRTGSARVAVLRGGALSDVNVNDFRINMGNPTSVVNFVNNLSSNSTSATYTVGGITVYDRNGGVHTLSAAFTNNSVATPGSWLATVTDTGTGNTVASAAEIRFQGDGSPAAGFNVFSFAYTPNGGGSQSIQFNFGSPGGFSGATNFSGGATSTMNVGSQDGFAPGAMTKLAFDAGGTLVFSYSNGKTFNGPRLALAMFADLQALSPEGGRFFRNATGQKVELGSAKSGAFGQIVGGAIESANVDLAREFSELIVLQRGYQASSEALTAANEMAQQLLALRGKQG